MTEVDLTAKALERNVWKKNSLLFRSALGSLRSAFLALCSFLLAFQRTRHRENSKINGWLHSGFGAALPFFIAVEEKLFQKHGLEISPYSWAAPP